MTITHAAFNQWASRFPNESYVWIDDDVFEHLAYVLGMDSRVLPEAPTFAITYRGIVHVFRRSQYGITNHEARRR